MSIAEKLTTIAENVNKVYEAGKTAGGGGNVEDSPFYYAEKLDAVFNNAVFPENYEAVIKLKKAPKQCCFLFYNALYYKSAKLISEDQTNIVNFECSFLFGYHIEGKESLETVDLTEFNNKFSNIKMCFQLQSKLKNILGALDLSECSDVTNAFNRCDALENIEFVPNSIPISISFSSCTKLTHDSLMSIINGLAHNTTTPHQIDPLPDYDNGPRLTETIDSAIDHVVETDTAYIVYDKTSRSLSFPKDRYSDDIISLLVNDYRIVWSCESDSDMVVTITSCVIYSGASVKVLTLGTTNLNKLTDEEKAIATEKGWTLV